VLKDRERSTRRIKRFAIRRKKQQPAAGCGQPNKPQLQRPLWCFTPSTVSLLTRLPLVQKGAHSRTL